MISLLLLFVCCICFVLWKGCKDSGLQILPPKYPGQLPLIGHAYLFLGDSTKLWRRIKELTMECIKNGGVIHFYMGPELYYAITDPDDILKVSNSCLQRHFAYQFAKPWLGDGLGTASVETWKRHRRLLNPAFTLPVVHSFLDVFNDQSKKMVDDIAIHVNKGRFDHSVYMMKLAFETFCMAAFGIDSSKDNKFIEEYMQAVDETFSIIVRRFQQFWLHSDLMFHLSGLKRRAEDVLKTLNAISYDVSNNNFQGIRHKALLDLMLKLSAEDALTDKEMREQIDTTITAGTDTSASLLTCLLALMGSHQEIQEKMHEEIMEVLGTDRDVSKEDLQKLVYTEAVIKETLRYIPTIPIILRYVDKSVQLKNYSLRAGSQCALLLAGALWDPSWGDDVAEFRPERWLDPASLPANSNAFAAFSLGKRYCLGKAYAITSIKVTLAHFFRAYRVKSDVSNLRLKLDFVLKPESGYEISLERRY